MVHGRNEYVTAGSGDEYFIEAYTSPPQLVICGGRYEEGRTSSIRAGPEAVPEGTEDILLIGVDQPRTPGIVARVVDAHLAAGSLVTSPRYRGRGGHPLMFSVRLMPELRLISERNQGLGEVFERHRTEVTEVHFDDPVVRLDLNTPEAYERAYERYGRKGSSR